MSRKSALTKKVTESDGWQRALSRDSDPGRGRPICHRGVITLFAVSYEQRIYFACQIVGHLASHDAGSKKYVFVVL